MLVRMISYFWRPRTGTAALANLALMAGVAAVVIVAAYVLLGDKQSSDAEVFSRPEQEPNAAGLAPGLSVAPVSLDPPACDSSQSPLYCIYEVREGDTISSIASAFGLASTQHVPAWEILIANNPDGLRSPEDMLHVGMKIRIPTRSADPADVQMALFGLMPAVCWPRDFYYERTSGDDYTFDQIVLIAQDCVAVHDMPLCDLTNRLAQTARTEGMQAIQMLSSALECPS